jgi:lambda repressor-like predicted transcriptional regulator
MDSFLMLQVAYRSTLPVMSDQRTQDREWIESILRDREWSATELSRRAGISQTTLTRFLNDPNHPFGLSERSKSAIARAIGLVPQASVPPQRPLIAGFYEPDAVEYDAVKPEQGQIETAMLKAAQAIRPHTAKWILRTSILDALGYRPGDILFVDLNERAKPGDLVCAQVYDWPRNRAETVFRLLDPPFLLAGTDRGKPVKPLIVDDQAIVVRGVVIDVIRPRLYRPAA